MAKNNFSHWGGETLYPRSYQKPLIAAIRNNHYKRACCVWHRRAGKDINVFANIVVPEAYSTVGNYYYYFPTLRLGRKVIWEGKTKDGRRYLDFLPKGCIKKVNNSDMQITLSNNSIIQIVGLDNPDLTVRGTGPIGCVFSEYAEQPKSGWETVSPVLLENDGWAIFIYTPKGKNHGQELFEMAKVDDNWFCQLLTIEHTRKDAPGEDGERVMSDEKIDMERAQGRDEAFIQQEYYCSFEGIMVGSIYGDLIKRMRADGRIYRIPHNPSKRVYTAWDIGHRDDTSVIFFQDDQNEIRIIDYMEASGKGLGWWLTELETEHRRLYMYDEHLAPWDFEHHSFVADGKTAMDVARERGFRFRVVPRSSKQTGIEAVRNVLPRVCIDEYRARLLVDALTHYHREFDEKRGCYKESPKKDWSSHACDAMQVLAQGYRPTKRTDMKRPTKAITDFDPRAKNYGKERRKVKVITGWSPSRKWR